MLHYNNTTHVNDCLAVPMLYGDRVWYITLNTTHVHDSLAVPRLNGDQVYQLTRGTELLLRHHCHFP